jgi:hypothetical protein
LAEPPDGVIAVCISCPASFQVSASFWAVLVTVLRWPLAPYP